MGCDDHLRMVDIKQILAAKAALHPPIMSDNKRKSTSFQAAMKRFRREALESARSYHSNVGLHSDRNTQHRANQEEQDLTILDDIGRNACVDVLGDCEKLLQNAIIRPQTNPQVYDPESSNYNILIWDTETTGFGRLSEIIQISIMSKDERFTFSEYITPTTDISLEASFVNKLTTKISNGDVILFKDGIKVRSEPLEQCFPKVLDFIQETRDSFSKESHKPVITVMVAHSSAKFDAPIFLRSVESSFVEKLTNLNVLFADSLFLFKAIRKSGPTATILSQCPDNQMMTLYEYFFNDETFNAHDGLEDARALNKILFNSSLEITPKQVVELGGTMTAREAYDDVKFVDQRYSRVEAFPEMFHLDGRRVISDTMKQKLAVNGISYESLKEIYRQFGKTGLYAILALPSSSETGMKTRPRITYLRRIQASILEYIESTVK